MSNWQDGYVQGNGIRLHYYRTGQGDKPPVLLAHGFSDDGLCWTRVAKALEADYDVIMVDARGHGLSDAPEGGYDSLTQAGDLRAVIEGLELYKPAVIGHSMGAANTLALAGSYPEVPGAIVLEDPPAWWVPDSPRGFNPEWQSRMREWITHLKSKTRDQLIEECRQQNPSWSEDELGPWADSKLRLSEKVLNRSDPPQIDWEQTTKAIRCLALLITGDNDRGAIVRPEQAEALRALVPQLEIVHIPGTGHNIRREGFDTFMSAVSDFLRRWARSR